MDHAFVRDLYDTEMRRNARPEGPDGRIERVGNVVRHTGPPLGWNGVIWSDLDETTADGAIAEQLAHYAALEGGRTWEWKLYHHDLPSDLGGRLREAGFEPDEPETLMVAEVAGLAVDAAPPEGIRLVPVTDAAGVDLMMAVHDRAFGGPPRPDLHRQLLDLVTGPPGRVAAVVAMAGDEPVSAARLEMLPGAPFAGLWGGGTVEEWRGRGIYRALVAHRARIAAEHGVPYLQVDASDQSRPILERLGFVPLGVTVPYVWQGGDDRGGPASAAYGTDGTDTRVGPPLTGGERETLRAFLDFQRATLAMKCEGLTDEQLRRRSSPPSTLSLLGLVRHMAEVERAWFRRTIDGEDVPLVWSDEGDFQVAYDASAATRSEAFGAWEAEVAHARRIEAAAASLDVTGHQARWGEDVSLRLVMLHLIHEYARHNGHADFLREAIDGTVGA